MPPQFHTYAVRKYADKEIIHFEFIKFYTFSAIQVIYIYLFMYYIAQRKRNFFLI